MNNLQTFVHSLSTPISFDHPASSIRVIETHISWILLTGDYAYKIKKPLDLGFLDFSTLDKRLAASEEEVRLNRRTAPDIYIGVVPITGTPEAPHVNNAGEAFEYAVKMRQFPAEAMLDKLDAKGGMTARQVESIAATLARPYPKGTIIQAATAGEGLRRRRGNHLFKFASVWKPLPGTNVKKAGASPGL